MATNRLEPDTLPKEDSDGASKRNKLEKKLSGKDNNSLASSTNGTDNENIESNGKDTPVENNMTTSSTTTDSDSKSEESDSPPVGKKKKKKKNAQDRLRRRIKHFRKLFQSEIPDELPTLIDTYVCAYQGDILLQGKMYITDRYLCFYSRIINYVTRHVYRWEEINFISKERVAFIFPTAIGLRLSEPKRKIIYASFLARDDAYEKIKSIWTQHQTNPDLGDDDESTPEFDGTLKPSEKFSTFKADKRTSYDSNGSSPQDNPVTENAQGGASRVPPNDKNNIPQSAAVVNGRRYSIERNSSNNRKHNNASNENDTTLKNRQPRKGKYDQSHDDRTKRNRSSNAHQTRNRSTSQRAPSQNVTNQQSSATQPALYNSNVLPSSRVNTELNPVPNTNSSSIDGDGVGISTRVLNMFMSFINLIIQNVSSLFRHLQMSSSRTTIFILLLLALLFFHSFYLIALAYRVENRLHSLHSIWPSSLFKNSLSSSK